MQELEQEIKDVEPKIVQMAEATIAKRQTINDLDLDRGQKVETLAKLEAELKELSSSLVTLKGESDNELSEASEKMKR